MGVLFASGVGAEGKAATPGLELVWSVDGGAFGSSRSLEPTIAIGSDTIFVDANLTKGDRRHEIIRAFDKHTGRPVGIIEHPDGAPFEGLGDAIAVNNRYLVTALGRRGWFRRGGQLLIYDPQSLKLLRRIDNPRRSDASYFGLNGVVLHEDRVLTSATIAKNNISTVWVFSAETGETLLTIHDPGAQAGGSGAAYRSVFGRALAMNSTHIVVAANDRTGARGLAMRGIVYVFDARDGSLLYRLRSPGSDTSSNFGSTLTLSEDYLYVSALDGTGPLNWPTGMLHAYDLKSGELRFTVSDPDVPRSLEEFSRGKEGWGFANSLAIEGAYLFSGLPEWSGTATKQGGVMVLDAQTGENLFTYGHERGAEWGRFGNFITVGHGHLAVMQNIDDGGPGAMRLALYKITTP